jgi:glycosyltransferase involved in cell wall biosynthesis
MIILIPCYEPGEQLLVLVRSIHALRPNQAIVLVDDGSGPGSAEVFATCEALGCEVVSHRVNRGKGAALKTGFAHIAECHLDHDVICADCDGQHTMVDILRVADEVAHRSETIVLGARRFATNVPARSRFGNGVTRLVFRIATGTRLQDTQTGLRGYSASMLAWLQTIDGDRFEYELETLLMAEGEGLHFHEVPIETVYLGGNESSHFRPIRDSIRVYVPLVRYAASSMVAFAVVRGRVVCGGGDPFV